MNKFKILVADDHKLFREGIKFLLLELDFISEIREASNGEMVLNILKEFQADLILMDISMPKMNGIETSREVLQHYPDIKIIALSMHSDENYYSGMIEAGALGFVSKDSDFEEVKKAILVVLEGKNYFSKEIMESIIKNLYQSKGRYVNSFLTDREIEVLYNICKGYSNQEIADILFISKRTVDKHRENLLLKTGLKNTAGLVVYAIKNGIFHL